MATKISFWELRDYLVLDPWYGHESGAIDSLLIGIYRDNQHTDNCNRFHTAFSWKPCKQDRYRELICLWCVMGLPAYQQGRQVDWRPEELAERWTEDFDIELDELKDFLRHHKWPLPINFFPSEPDNSEAKVRFEQSEYTDGWKKVEQLAAVKSQIEDWESKTTATAEGQLRKEARLRKLYRQREQLQLWLDEYGPEERATNVARRECRELLEHISDWQEYVSQTPSDRDRQNLRVRELKSALVRIISQELGLSYDQALAVLPGVGPLPGLEECLSQDEFLLYGERLSPQTQRRRDQQIKVILDAIAALGFEPMAVESKAQVREKCLHDNFGLFTDSGFDHAWKAASNKGLLRIKDRDKYLARRIDTYL